jgi:RND superfamily putative drug exporter
MMVQAGFVLGMGILLDTFLVRTVTVPAIATLVGKGNWWPSKPREHKSGARTTSSQRARFRKALKPRFFSRRRRETAPNAEGPELAPDDQMVTNDAEPPVGVGRAPLIDIRRLPFGRRLRR